MTFRDLIAWKKGIDFVVLVYAFTNQLPETEKYGLCSQLQRAATSVPSNIAEGYGRTTPKEFARFLDVAMGSIREIQTQLEICYRLGFAEPGIELEKADELAKVVYALARSVRKRSGLSSEL